MRIIIVQKITNINNNLYKTRLCPMFLILYEKSSFFINQVAELLTFIELINSVSF